MNYASREMFRTVTGRPSAPEMFVELMTHPAPRRVAQLYDRLSLY